MVLPGQHCAPSLPPVQTGSRMCTDLSWQKPHWPLPLLRLSEHWSSRRPHRRLFFFFVSLPSFARWGFKSVLETFRSATGAVHPAAAVCVILHEYSSTTYILLLRVLHLVRSMAHGPYRRAIQHQLFLLQQCNAGHCLDPLTGTQSDPKASTHLRAKPKQSDA